jgi:O-antigen ligase
VAGLLALALLFLLNILYLLVSIRQSMVVAIVAVVTIPLLLLLLVRNLFGARAMLGLLAGAAVLCAVAWTSSPYLRAQTAMAWEPIAKGEVRVEYWWKSLPMMGEAPVFGHGTGSIRQLFDRAAMGNASSRATDPHQQTFGVGIQLGLVGVAVLWAMWLAHVLLFRGDRLEHWIGSIVVIQNIVSSVLDSHLFDFNQGWTYVLLVGAAGGMVRRLGAQEAFELSHAKKL